jgi:hypothetical protein
VYTQLTKAEESRLPRVVGSGAPRAQNLGGGGGAASDVGGIFDVGIFNRVFPI